MGPNLIFDKSFLQSINVDESVWLDMFFYTNITPLFYIETLADLEKEMNKGRTAEQVVGNLAYKTPDMYAVPNMHHRTILYGELSGQGTVDMRYGRPIVGGGRETVLNGKKGAVFEQSPEEAAFERWQKKQFLEIERFQAKGWRNALSLISPRDQQSMFAGWYGDKKPKSLVDVKKAADDYIDGDNRKSALSFGLELLDIPKITIQKIIDRWRSSGSPNIMSFAPYFRHIYGIELFFYLARSAGLISSRRTNKVDIAYLYYLPFCMVFVSNDLLHRDTVPLFLQDHQSFVWGIDLKSDLTHLDQYYSDLPEEVKARGLHYFASLPPHDTKFLVTRLWDTHMRPDWRNLNNKSKRAPSGTSDSDIIAEVKRAAEAPETRHGHNQSGSDKLDYIVTKHYVHKKKGKWNRFPPEVDESK